MISSPMRPPNEPPLPNDPPELAAVAHRRVTAAARARQRGRRDAERRDRPGAARRPRGRHALTRLKSSAPPQLAQNFAPGAAAVPHWVQCTAFGAIAVPQLEQNFAPGAFGAWQLAQATPPRRPGWLRAQAPAPPPGFRRRPGAARRRYPPTMPPSPMPTPRAAAPLPPPAAAPSPMPLSAAPTPYSRKPPARRVYAVSLRKPLSVCSSSGLRLMVTLPSRVIFSP